MVTQGLAAAVVAVELPLLLLVAMELAREAAVVPPPLLLLAVLVALDLAEPVELALLQLPTQVAVAVLDIPEQGITPLQQLAVLAELDAEALVGRTVQARAEPLDHQPGQHLQVGDLADVGRREELGEGRHRLGEGFRVQGSGFRAE